jgi:hypothetical protein
MSLQTLRGNTSTARVTWVARYSALAEFYFEVDVFELVITWLFQRHQIAKI